MLNLTRYIPAGSTRYVNSRSDTVGKHVAVCDRQVYAIHRFIDGFCKINNYHIVGAYRNAYAEQVSIRVPYLTPSLSMSDFFFVLQMSHEYVFTWQSPCQPTTVWSIPGYRWTHSEFVPVHCPRKTINSISSFV